MIKYRIIENLNHEEEKYRGTHFDIWNDEGLNPPLAKGITIFIHQDDYLKMDVKVLGGIIKRLVDFFNKVL